VLTSLLPTLGIANTLGLSAFVLAYLLTYWSLTLLPRWGMVDQPDYQRHIHTRAVPRGGGIGMIVAFITVTLAFFGLAPLPSDTAFHAILKLLVPMAILLPLGILDDKFGLSPKTKFLFQTAAAILAWTLGFRLDNLFGATLPPWSSFILTVVWVVGFINAFNMIDGVDGLASGVGAISAVCMAVVAFSKGEYAFAVLLVTFIGALLGFLRLNWHPAKIFMGDSGSMFIGYVLAVSGLFLNARLTTVASIGVPLLACGIPLLDIVLAVWRRLLGTPHDNPITADLPQHADPHATAAAAESSPEMVVAPLTGNFATRCLQLLTRLGQADQRHLHHRLMLYYRKNQRKTVASIYLLATAMGAVGMLCCFLPGRNLLLALVIILGTFSFIINRLAVVELWRTTELAYQNFQSAQAGVKITYVLNPLVDLAAIAAAYCIVAGPATLHVADLLRYLGVLMVTLLATRSYRVFWNFVVSDDYFRLIWTLFLGFALARLSDFLIPPHGALPPHLHLYAAGLAVSAILLERLGIHYLRNSAARRTSTSALNDTGKIRTALYGITPMTRFYRNRLLSNLDAAGAEQLVGIIAQEPGYLHSQCFGMKVLGMADDLERIVRETHVNKLVLTIALPPEKQLAIHAFCVEKNLRLTEFGCHENIIG